MIENINNFSSVFGPEICILKFTIFPWWYPFILVRSMKSPDLPDSKRMPRRITSGSASGHFLRLWEQKLPVFGGGQTGMVFEHLEKVGGRMKSVLQGYLLDG